MQDRHRLDGGWGGGSTLLFMLSLLSVCGIKRSSFLAHVVVGWNFNLLIVF